MEKQRQTFAKCTPEPESRPSSLTFGRVDTCTSLLPEMKPRYVMGIVRHDAVVFPGTEILTPAGLPRGPHRRGRPRGRHV